MIADRSGIEIDYCPNCRGVWLDRGELDKIIERSAQEIARPAQPYTSRPEGYRYDDDDDYRKRESSYGHHHKKKKKDFFEDLFDF